MALCCVLHRSECIFHGVTVVAIKRKVVSRSTGTSVNSYMSYFFLLLGIGAHSTSCSEGEIHQHEDDGAREMINECLGVCILRMYRHDNLSGNLSNLKSFS